MKIGRQGNSNLEEGLAQPLLLGVEQRQDENSDDNDDTEVSSERSHEPATSIASAYRLLTPSVKVSLPLHSQLLIFLCLVLVQTFGRNKITVYILFFYK
jgi:hypothetical protein